MPTSDEAQRRFFERIAARYDDRFFRERWPRNQRIKAVLVAEALGDALDGVVVEVGCGTGQIAAELLEARPHLQYVGVDLSAAMLERARHRLARFGDRARLVEATATSLPVDARSADGAFGLDVLHHVPDPIGSLREVERALRRGGRTVFLEGNPLFPVTALIGLLQREERGLLRLSRGRLASWFTAAGFADVEVDLAPLFTPPGPPRLAPLWDRVDRTLPHVPGLRALALFLRASATASPE